ncbi:MAG: peptidase [Acidobacteriota bacterium]
MLSFKRVTVAIALLAVVAVPAFGAKAPTHNRDLEMGIAAPAATQKIGNERVDLATGVPVALYHQNFKADHAAPEEMAKQYLRAAEGLLKLNDPSLNDLKHHATQEALSGHVVRYRQQYDGVPVYGGEVTIKINNDDRVTFVMNTYKKGVDVDTTAPTVSAEQARTIAHDYLNARGGFHFDRASLVIYPGATAGRLAHRIYSSPKVAPIGDWEVLVDAHTGEIFRVQDKMAYGGSTSVDGTGDVFEPDPLTSATATYGDTGYVDGNDADTAQLLAEIFSRTLQDITLDSGTHSLVGPWAEITDWASPFKGLFTQASSDFAFTREQDGFEAANTYFHIDVYMRYLNDTLGLNIEPYQYPGGVQFDPHGFNGADNSSYSSGTGRLQFGEGGVDDAEDADVVIHELGHGLHDWATVGGLSQVEGLSEGIGDYVAAEYSRFFGFWDPADDGYDHVFSWDGHNAFWGGRRSDWNDTRTYPQDLSGGIHTQGQFWSSCNMDVWDAIGRDLSVTAHWEGLKATNNGTNQDDAAAAVVQAAADLGFDQADIDAIVGVFQGCGYSVTAPPIFADGFESGDILAWSSSVE